MPKGERGWSRVPVRANMTTYTKKQLDSAWGSVVYVTHLLWGDNFNQLQNVDPLGQQPLPLASVGKHTSDRSTASWAVEESRCRRVCADVVQDPTERWQTVGVCADVVQDPTECWQTVGVCADVGSGTTRRKVGQPRLPSRPGLQ